MGGAAATDVVVDSQWGGEGSMVFAKMDHSVDGREDRASKWGATEAKSNDFTMNAILLSGEGVSSKGGSHEFSNGSQGNVEVLVADEKLDVSEGEGCGV